MLTRFTGLLNMWQKKRGGVRKDFKVFVLRKSTKEVDYLPKRGRW